MRGRRASGRFGQAWGWRRGARAGQRDDTSSGAPGRVHVSVKVARSAGESDAGARVGTIGTGAPGSVAVGYAVLTSRMT
jgi:hypothetical protein